jgi:hypothetical protein
MYVRGYLQGSENGRVVTIGHDPTHQRTNFTETEYIKIKYSDLHCLESDTVLMKILREKIVRNLRFVGKFLP